MTDTQAGPAGLTPRARVLAALGHVTPDRVPTDFLATPEIWEGLVAALRPDAGAVPQTDYVSIEREAVLRHLEIDCRMVSYDMFCCPPDAALHPGAAVDWWGALARSTPCRMWRQRNADGTWNDIWGIHTRRVENASGAYEELASHPLQQVTSVEALKDYPWPQPEWWDFGPLPGLLSSLDPEGRYAWRYRIGSVFETAWQLRGMTEFLSDLATDPAIPLYIMDRLAEVHAENLRRALAAAGDRIDVVYFYDDVATQNSLMISRLMWRRLVRPRHAQIIEPALAAGKQVMYHCDGAIYPLIPELLELGVNILNPIQPDARGMDPERLKAEFGDRLAFHGGIDIVKTLPRGTPQEVAAEVRDRIRVLGEGGGYILCSSHHIQADTPLANVFAMYDPEVIRGERA
jgi:uroporphyrinogen decarboxylase